MLKGILFDLGGTLYSYANLRQANQDTLRTLTQALSVDHDFAAVEKWHAEITGEVDRFYMDRPYYLYRDYFLTIFERLLQRLDRPAHREHFDWFEEYQRVALLTSMRLYDDCHATLRELRAAGLYLSVVSNADENMLKPLIARAGLKDFLDDWTSSEGAQSCKPDRRFFEVALAKSGLRADQVLFVGDSLEQDIAGAHRLGIKTVLINEFDRPAPMHTGRDTPQPDYKIRRLSELPAIAASLR